MNSAPGRGSAWSNPRWQAVIKANTLIQLVHTTCLALAINETTIPPTKTKENWKLTQSETLPTAITSLEGLPDEGA